MLIRNWCYTKQGKVDIVYNDKIMKYKISEPEIAPSTKKEHWQGFIVLIRTQRLSYMKSIDSEAHWEPANGSIEDNIKYCSKEGKAIEFGTKDKCGQGKRTDLVDVNSALKEGANISKIVKDYGTSFMKYSNGIIKTKYFLDKEKAKIWRDVICYCFYGATGTGKTKQAIQHALDNDEDYYILNSNSNGTLWFDGYDGEEVLIIDDFYGWIKQHELLRICDGYSYHCQLKGSFTWAKWHTVIFTSNKSPDEWYKDGLSSAFLRRCPKDNWSFFKQDKCAEVVGNTNDSTLAQGESPPQYSKDKMDDILFDCNNLNK